MLTTSMEERRELGVPVRGGSSHSSFTWALVAAKGLLLTVPVPNMLCRQSPPKLMLRST